MNRMDSGKSHDEQIAATRREFDLLSTTDAQTWAEEFATRFLDDPIQREKIDRGLMVSWFANAIETGRTAGEANVGA